jgi:hypothetical protein
MEGQLSKNRGQASEINQGFSSSGSVIAKITLVILVEG